LNRLLLVKNVGFDAKPHFISEKSLAGFTVSKIELDIYLAGLSASLKPGS